MSSKAESRKKLLALRRAIPAQERAEKDRAIAAACVAWWKAHDHPAAVLAVYMPMQGEPDLHACFAALDQIGVQLALPVVQQVNAPLIFAAWKPGEELSRDLCGATVPAQQRVVAPNALLIPCLGFTAYGYRLGYGAGYYDRTLAALHSGSRPMAIGISYDAGLTEFMPDRFDERMDMVITESQQLLFGRT